MLDDVARHNREALAHHGLEARLVAGDMRDPFAFEDESFDLVWDVKRPDGTQMRMDGPRQWRHALSTLVNELVDRGFGIDDVWESEPGDISAKTGSWDHYKAIAPPWLTFWATLGLAAPGA